MSNLFALLLTGVLMHPVHETVSEVQWNPETKRLEVALRLDVLDEQWLRRRYANGRDLEQWATEYLAKQFRVDPPPTAADSSPSSAELPTAARDHADASTRRDTYHWIGRKQDGARVWWFFEIEPASAKRPAVIEQRVLFESDSRYINQILVLGSDPKRSFGLTADQPRGPLTKPPF